MAGVFSLPRAHSLININQMDVKTLIIGAGPSGIAAAIQLKHLGEKFAILEKGEVGGLLLSANRVENYPGALDSPSGPELVRRFREHLNVLKIDVISADVQSVRMNEDGTYTTETTDRTYQSRNLIVATGTKPIPLPNHISTHAIRRRLFYDVRQLRDLTGKEIFIVGGGDAAFDYALTLSKRNRVTIIYRSARPKCHSRLYQEVSENPEISLVPNRSIKTWNEIGKADYILVAIGREPSVDFLSDKLKKCFSEGRNIPNLYFAGDVARGRVRQTAIAVGDGTLAAFKIANG